MPKGSPATVAPGGPVTPGFLRGDHDELLGMVDPGRCFSFRLITGKRRTYDFVCCD